MQCPTVNGLGRKIPNTHSDSPCLRNGNMQYRETRAIFALKETINKQLKCNSSKKYSHKIYRLGHTPEKG